jgi:hypothetical protein
MQTARLGRYGKDIRKRAFADNRKESLSGVGGVFVCVGVEYVGGVESLDISAGGVVY